MPKYKATELKLEKIQNDIARGCTCGNNCAEKMSVNTVLEYRQRLYVLPQGPARQTRLLELYQMTNISRKWGKEEFIINGETVCRMAWSRICLGISNRTYRRLKSNVNNEVKYVEPSCRYLRAGKGLRGSIATGFLAWFVEKTGDFSPDSARIMMPSCLTIKSLYEEYRKDYPEDPIQRAQFYKLWNENFQHVTFPKNPRMTQCKLCMLLKDSISKEVNLDERESLIVQRNEHLNRQQNERSAYYTRRAESEKNPDAILSIILDGMDQKKGDLPHFKGHADPKGIGQYKLKTHITGALSHSHNRLYSLIDVGQYSHDTNLTLSCLLEVLHKEAKHGQLPPKLYVQLDNCGRENKNKYFIGFMAYLVKKKYLEEITMSFLMVGHTHEDIDQRFSKYAHKLQMEDAKTLGELVHLLEEAMDPKPLVTVLQRVWNIKDWLSPSLMDIHNQSFPHVYRIYLNTFEDVKLQFKNVSTDPVWLPDEENSPELEVFKRESGMQMVPHGHPDLCEMNFKQEDITALKHSITRSKDVLNYDQYQWWQTFLDNPKDEVKKASNQNTNWLLLGHYKTPALATPAISDDTSAVIDRLLTKEREGREVTNSIRRKPRSQPEEPQRRRTKETAIQIILGYMVIFSNVEKNSVGKIAKIEDGFVRLELFRDMGNGVYSHVTRASGQAVLVTVPKGCVLHSFIKLTAANRLPGNTAVVLQKLDSQQTA